MLRIRGLRVTLGGRAVLDDLDLEVGDGEVMALLGPSGSGKSTLLRVVAGLQAPDAGSLEWDGRSLEGVPPHRRGFGLMFQDLALFPHKDVAANVAFGLRMAGVEGKSLRDRVAEVLGWVGLAGYEARAVGSLSGGEQQRVALARALAPRPQLLMLDEPLGSLDRVLRDRLLPDLRSLLRERGGTSMYVTHDHEEALGVADRLVLLRQGSVAQVGTPAEVWSRPADEWVARFLGFSNLLSMELAGGRARASWGGFRLPSSEAGRQGVRTLIVRSSGFARASGQEADLRGQVTGQSFRGSHYLVEVRLADGQTLEVELPLDGLPAAGEEIALQVDPGSVVVLEPADRAQRVPT